MFQNVNVSSPRFEEAARLPLPAAAAALAFVPVSGGLPPVLSVACGAYGTLVWSQASQLQNVMIAIWSQNS